MKQSKPSLCMPRLAPCPQVGRLCLWLCCATLASPISGAQLGRTTTVPMESGFRVQETLLADFNADSIPDLLVACSNNRRAGRRQLRIHAGTNQTVWFQSEPDWIYDCPPDVVAFGTGDFLAPTGDELLLFTVSGVYAWTPTANRRARPVQLLDINLLWQLPDQRHLVPWQDGIRDWNGDGLLDLLIPEPDGFRLAVRAADNTADTAPGFLDPIILRMESRDPAALSTGQRARRMEVRHQARQLSLSLDLGDSDPKYQRTSLSIRESIAAPMQADWDGDGRPDLLALSPEDLFVWPFNQPNGLPQAPPLRLEFPVAMDAARFLDVSFSAHAVDLDRDRKSDCVILAGDRNSTEPRTQVLVYLQPNTQNASASSQLFGEAGHPDQLLLVSGFAGMPQLTDCDGDGFPDLFLARVQLTSMEALRAATSGQINAELLLYRNQNGRFSSRPDATMTLALPADEFTGTGSGAGVFARWIGDVTGNGMQDLLLRDQPGRLRIFALGKTRNGLGFTPRPIFETNIADHARIRFPNTGTPEILVLEGNKTVHMRFQ
ncbi:MAG: VCBS repeat-containing protein [Verrucomicrobiota bacterium]|nr:VCBS repeat-containing protein [Verrucomicrobiota bacterium]